MVAAEDPKLQWAYRGLIMLGVVGVVAIGWAVWLLTTTTSQSAEADRAAAIQQRELAAALATVTPTPPPTATPPPTSTPAPTPTPTVQVPSGSAVVPPPTPTPTATAVPAVTPTPTPTPTATVSQEVGPAPTPVVNSDGQQVGTNLAGWNGFDEFPPDFSGPELNEGPNQVSFTLAVEVPDGGGETFVFADSSGQFPNTVGASRQTYSVPMGTFTIEHKSPSGWPPPVVTCVGAEQVGTQGSVTMELETDTNVECTFVLVRDADSLSVLDNTSSCDGLAGRVLGPEGPFWITYQAEGSKSPSGGFSLFNVGTIRVERPGVFITPPDFVAQAGLDDGDYPIWITVWDDTGSYVPFLDATTLRVGDCS